MATEPLSEAEVRALVADLLRPYEAALRDLEERIGNLERERQTPGQSSADPKNLDVGL